MSEIKRVGVLGCGLMGSGIAQVAAAAGYDTVVRDVSKELLDRGRAGIEKSLAKFVEKGKLDAAARDATLKRLTFTTTVADLKGADIVIEAITEDLALKNALYKELDGLCGPATIFASNTSSLTIIEIAAATKRPDRFAGLHFFNPPVVMQLVEVVKAITTSDATVETLRAFVTRLGHTPVVCKDTPGFIVNRLMIPIMLEAIRALEQGVATPEDIDKAVKLGLRHPMGPFELIDYTGLDINLHVANTFFDEFRDPAWAPPPLLKRMVLAGHLGVKTGKGFYEYDENGKRKP